MVTRRRQQLATALAVVLAIAAVGAAVWFARSHNSSSTPTGTTGTFTQPGVVTVPSTQIQHTGSNYSTQDFAVVLPAGATDVKETTGTVTQVVFSDGQLQARVRSQALPAGQTLEDVALVYGQPSSAKRIVVGGHKAYLYTFKSGDQVSQIAVTARGATVYFIQIVSPTSQLSKAAKLLSQLSSKTTLK